MSGKRILVVDDDESVLILLKTELESAGFAVETASTGETAIRKAREFQPQMLIIDLVLPDISGGEVARTVRNHFGGQDVPFIFLTGMLTRREAADSDMGVQVGDRSYEAVAKPFDKREILNRIERILGP